jgi:hypothetical protein
MAALGLAFAKPTDASGASQVSAITRGVSIASSPQLTGQAPSPTLSDEARSHLSGAAESAYFGKWRNNPDMRSQYAAEHNNGGVKANGFVGAVLPLIKTLSTVNNRALDTTFAFTESETTVAQPIANDIVVAYNSFGGFLAWRKLFGLCLFAQRRKNFYRSRRRTSAPERAEWRYGMAGRRPFAGGRRSGERLLLLDRGGLQ